MLGWNAVRHVLLQLSFHRGCPSLHQWQAQWHKRHPCQWFLLLCPEYH